MKVILAQPSIFRFEWELEVCLTNLRKHGVKNIVLLFSAHNQNVIENLKSKYDFEYHVYKDDRLNKDYIPSIKPYLFWQYLKEDETRQFEDYFYFDSDVIFRKLPDFNKIKFDPMNWIGSNCNSYLNADYIQSVDEKLLEGMCDIVGVASEDVSNINSDSCGAQWIISCPTIAYWKKVYEDSQALYDYLKKSNTSIQAWTAEMWSQLWNALYFGKTVSISRELDFCWATDDVEKWDSVKIMHNAGVIDEYQRLFFKGKYVASGPFQADLSFVDKTKCSSKYVEAIKEVDYAK